MQIRTRLTLQFILIGGIIMIFLSVAIYFSSAQLRREDFYNRLRNKARITAKLLLDADETDPGRVRIIENELPDDLHNEKIIIINYLNDTIYSTDEKGEIEIRNDILERVRLYERINYTQGEYDVLGTLYSNFLYRFVVIAAATDTEGFLHLRKLKYILTGTFFISLILFFIAGWVFAGRALKPISDVVKRVRDITITSMNLRVPEGNGTDEIGRLARTFNDMLQRLEVSFATQKDFIANASHELRTPLTSINGQLEVLLMKDRSTGEYRAALTSVLDDLRALIIMTNKLLLLARTSEGSTTGLNNKVRVDEILWQIRDEIRKIRHDYNVDIKIDDSLTDSEQMIVKGDENLLKTAFSNIVENACKFSDNHSVEITIEASDKELNIIFRDKGIGIDEDELSKIFEPFYRAGNAISIHGTGIGLSLVSQIIKNHNGSIKIESQKDKGTTVTVILPIY